jgi:predicted membrane protein
MGLITAQIYKQITEWRLISIALLLTVLTSAGISYIVFDIPIQIIFYVSCAMMGFVYISWWYWCISTMITMLAIMKDTDDHFDIVAKQLEALRTQITKPELKLVKTVDTEK